MSSVNGQSLELYPAAVPDDVRNFIEFFRQELSALAFPDLDVETFDVLERAIEGHARQVEAAYAQWTEQKEALAAVVAQLCAEARRGLAYVHIYAHDKPDLAAKVSSLEFEKDKLAPKKKKAPSQAPRRLRVAEAEAKLEDSSVGQA